VPLKGGYRLRYRPLLFCLAVFGREYTAVGLVTLGLLDSVSTIAGLRFGRHTIRGSKSLEGTLTGAVAAALALIFLVPWWAAVVVAGVAGVVEAYSPLDDNVAIQVAVCLTLALMGVVVTVF